MFADRRHAHRPRAREIVRGAPMGCRRFGAAAAWGSDRLELIATDKLVLVMSDGTRETWTRARAE